MMYSIGRKVHIPAHKIDVSRRNTMVITDYLGIAGRGDVRLTLRKRRGVLPEQPRLLPPRFQQLPQRIQTPVLGRVLEQPLPRWLNAGMLTSGDG